MLVYMLGGKQKQQYKKAKIAKILIESVAFRFFQITHVIRFVIKGTLILLLIHCLLLWGKCFQIFPTQNVPDFLSGRNGNTYVFFYFFENFLWVKILLSSKKIQQLPICFYCAIA